VDDRYILKTALREILPFFITRVQGKSFMLVFVLKMTGSFMPQVVYELTTLIQKEYSMKKQTSEHTSYIPFDDFRD
jgi:hypothetical protein